VKRASGEGYGWAWGDGAVELGDITLRFGWREVLGSFELGMLAVIRLRSCFLGIAAMNQMTRRHSQSTAAPKRVELHVKACCCLAGWIQTLTQLIPFSAYPASLTEVVEQWGQPLAHGPDPSSCRGPSHSRFPRPFFLSPEMRHPFLSLVNVFRSSFLHTMAPGE
jgi:hypothetical protein